MDFRLVPNLISCHIFIFARVCTCTVCCAANIAEEKTTSSTRKRKARGPYFSYLCQPLVKNIPRSTERSWGGASSFEGDEFASTNEQESLDISETADFMTAGFKTDGKLDDTRSVINHGEVLLDSADTTDEEYASVSATSCYMYDDTDGDNELIFADDCDSDEEWIDEAYDPTEIEGDGGDKASTPEEKLPLYDGSNITLGVSLLLIITFAMRHGLSGVALRDLLTLIGVHLISPNHFSKSVATLRHFFHRLKNPIQFHHYCSSCCQYIGQEKTKCCTNKHCLQDFTNKESLLYFIIIPLITQLQALLESKY